MEEAIKLFLQNCKTYLTLTLTILGKNDNKLINCNTNLPDIIFFWNLKILVKYFILSFTCVTEFHCFIQKFFLFFLLSFVK